MDHRKKTSLTHSKTQGSIHSELELLYKSGSFEKLYAEAVNFCLGFPSDTFIWNMRAAAALKLGKYTDAILAFKRVEQIEPRSHIACFNLGKVFLDATDFKASIKALNRSIKLNPKYTKAYDLKIRALFQNGQIEEAIATAKFVLKKNPNFDAFHNNLGAIYKDTDRYLPALDCFKKAVKIQPQNIKYRLNLANVEFDLFRFRSAIENYKIVISSGSQDDLVYIRLGEALAKFGDVSSACDIIKNAVACKPKSIELYKQFGIFLNGIGQFQEATNQFQKALEIDPQNTSVIRLLSNNIDHSSNNYYMKMIKQLLRNNNIPSAQKSSLHFALGKALEDIENYSEAYDNYKIGGQLKQKSMNYDIMNDEKSFSAVKSASRSFSDLNLPDTKKHLRTKPIFIVGMPRSGTTLVEQIISNHSLVHAGGELPLLSGFAINLTEGRVKPRTADLISIRENYLLSIEELSNNKEYVTDKMPHNFKHIALIKTLFKDCKIIHVKREPRATCWSNFKTYFGYDGLGYSYSLDHTVSFYNLYDELMVFWEKLFPKLIFTVQYEDLVSNTNETVTKLLSYLDLPFEKKCLSPETNTASVHTASQKQVRSEIYSGSSFAWKLFGKHISHEFKSLKNITN